jgi:uncharacterized membrane protein
MGVGHALLTLGGSVSGVGEVYAVLFWALFAGLVAAIVWNRYLRADSRRRKAPAEIDRRR